jgi:hypothetical protein
MARLGTWGNELGSLTAGVEWTLTSGSPTLTTSNVHAGTYAVEISSLASGTREGVALQLAASAVPGPYFFRNYYRFATLPSAENTILSGILTAAFTGTVSWRVTVDNNGALRLYNGASLVGSASANGTITTGSWFRIEVQFNKSGAGGTHVLRGVCNGTEWAGASNLTITNNILIVAMGGNLNAEAQTTGSWNMDDFAYNDTSGTAQTSYPGDGYIVHLHPNGAGASNTWQTSAGGAGSTTNYQAVDEVIPDDATTYLKRIATTIKVDDYTIESTSTGGIPAGSTVSFISVGIRGGAISNTASNQRNIVGRITPSGGSVQKSAAGLGAFSINGWRTIGNLPILYVNPVTSVAWTLANVDAVQIGAENEVSSTTESRLGTVWLTVEYVPASGTDTPMSMTLVTSTSAVVMQRGISVTMTRVTSSSTPRIVRDVGLIKSIVSSSVARILKNIPKTLLVTSSSNTVLNRAYGYLKQLLVTSSSVPTMVRNVGLNKLVTSTSSTTLADIVDRYRTLTVTSTSVARMIRDIPRTFLVTSNSNTSLARISGRLLNFLVSSSSVVNVLKNVGLPRSVTSTSETRMTRDVGLLKTVMSSSAVQMVRDVGLRFLVSSLSAVSEFHGAVQNLIKDFLVTSTSNVTMTRTYGLLRTFLVTSTSTPSLLRDIGKNLSQSSVSAVRIVRDVGYLKRVTSASQANLVRSIGILKLIVSASNVVMNRVHALSRTFTVVSTSVVSLGRTYDWLRSYLVTSTSVTNMYRSYALTFTVVSTSVASLSHDMVETIHRWWSALMVRLFYRSELRVETAYSASLESEDEFSGALDVTDDYAARLNTDDEYRATVINPLG